MVDLNAKACILGSENMSRLWQQCKAKKIKRHVVKWCSFETAYVSPYWWHWTRAFKIQHVLTFNDISCVWYVVMYRWSTYHMVLHRVSTEYTVESYRSTYDMYWLYLDVVCVLFSGQHSRSQWRKQNYFVQFTPTCGYIIHNMYLYICMCILYKYIYILYL